MSRAPAWPASPGVVGDGGGRGRARSRPRAAAGRRRGLARGSPEGTELGRGRIAAGRCGARSPPPGTAAGRVPGSDLGKARGASLFRSAPPPGPGPFPHPPSGWEGYSGAHTMGDLRASCTQLCCGSSRSLERGSPTIRSPVGPTPSQCASRGSWRRCWLSPPQPQGCTGTRAERFVLKVNRAFSRVQRPSAQAESNVK